MNNEDKISVEEYTLKGVYGLLHKAHQDLLWMHNHCLVSDYGGYTSSILNTLNNITVAIDLIARREGEKND